jgi:periplasmic protein TonB
VIIRLPIALLLGLLFTMGLFQLMFQLISSPINASTLREATRIEFQRMRQDTQVADKRKEKVVRDRPPSAPETPRMSFAASGVESQVAKMSASVDVGSALSKLKMSAGSDRDTIPLVRIPPEYPVRALNRGIQGWVIVQFTITETGTVKDAIVVDAQPKKIFDEAAIKAILRYRYNPKVEEGVAVERRGVQQKISFQLEK